MHRDPSSKTPGELSGQATVHDRARLRTWLTAAATCLVASLLIFLLPLHLPLGNRMTLSASYVAGFNNRVAVLAAAACSVIVFLATAWFRQRDLARSSHPAVREDTTEALPAIPQEQLGGGFIAIVIGLSALVLALGGTLVARSHLLYLGDAGYFIEQATTRLDTGRTLFTQLEFAYGPLLLLPTVWLSRLLHSTITFAYFTTLVIDESIGLVFLAFVLNELPMRRSFRRVAFVLCAIGAITPLLGVNYTFLRFATPMAVLLLASRSRSPWRSAVTMAAGAVLAALISPELGAALIVGVAAFAVARAWQQGAIWLITLALPVLALATIVVTIGRPFLITMATFSGGALNLPVAPYPHLLIFLFALIWIVPVWLGRNLNPHDPQSARLAGVYALGLAFLPPTLGRCDPLHVFFNGIGILLLSLVAVSRSPRRVRQMWLACLVLFVLWEHGVNDRLFKYRTAEVLGRAAMPHLPATLRQGIVRRMARTSPGLARELERWKTPEYRLDMAALHSIAGDAPVATPLEVSPAIREALRQSHQARPGYFGYWVDVFNAASAQRSVAELNAASWALLPDLWDGHPSETPAKIDHIQGFAFHYPQRNPVPYALGEGFKENLLVNWLPVERFGPYILYRKNPATAARVP